MIVPEHLKCKRSSRSGVGKPWLPYVRCSSLVSRQMLHYSIWNGINCSGSDAHYCRIRSDPSTKGAGLSPLIFL